MLKILGKRTIPTAPAGAPTLTDPETGLAGAELFAGLLEREIERSLRHGGEMTLAVFDVEVASFGRAANEPFATPLAPMVAAVLRDSARSSDLPARLTDSLASSRRVSPALVIS